MIDNIIDAAAMYNTDTLSALGKTAKWIVGRIKGFMSHVRRGNERKVKMR